MTLLAIKLILTPLLIGCATLVARRWGPAIGGWIAAMPFTSGPVSVFFVLEQGQEFAANAALNSVFGITAVTAFCVAYTRSAKSFSWPGALTIAIFSYGVAVFGLSLVPSSLLAAILLAAIVMSLGLYAIGHPTIKQAMPPPPWWDLPVRMVAATGVVLLVTGLASFLGPKWSGLISPFPVFACIMAIFSQTQSGPVAAQQLLRGIITGCFAFAAFFVVITLMIQSYNSILVYTVASLVAVAVNLATLKLFVR